MKSRLELNQILCDILGSDHAYFQPPETVKMEYPAIVYNLDDIDTPYADSEIYLKFKRYVITVIDKNPDTCIPDRILHLPLCSFDRYYTKNNLNHYVFRLYY